ncbi:MAG TPA: carbohydrate ABC transporter permease [Acidisoma sp.]|jgi:multiple sugar transport system permease protein/raffinose/stachyose/melibiose transport system permease protein|nr:carbohydrate ABC transporter permease [Acidisoma sp.]
MRGLLGTRGRLIASVLLGLVLIVMLFPFATIAQGSMDYAGHLSWRNWQVLFRNLPVAQELFNSTVITLGSVAVILVISALAAFALTKLRVPRGGALLGVIGASMMIPMQSMILTEFINFASFGLSDNFFAVIVTYAALGIPFGTFLMTSFMRDLPDELVEAAEIDGMPYWRIFLNVILPLSAPALLAVGVLQFIQIWDDLLVALIFLQEPTVRTITVGLAVLQSGRVLDIPVLLAGSLLSALPAMLAYLLFQRALIGGLMLGIGK